MKDKLSKLLFVFSLIIGGIVIGYLLYKNVPLVDYSIPLFIVLAIHIYLEDMFEKERKKKK